MEKGQTNEQRRTFLKGVSAAGLGAMVLITIRPKISWAASGNVVSEISHNHGHSFTIPLANLQSNGPTSYSIQGHASHNHNIEVTSAMIDALGRGEGTAVESDGDTHTHEVSLSIA